MFGRASQQNIAIKLMGKTLYRDKKISLKAGFLMHFKKCRWALNVYNK